METASRRGSETVFPVLTVPPAEEPPHQPQQQVEDRPLDHEYQWQQNQSSWHRIFLLLALTSVTGLGLGF